MPWGRWTLATEGLCPGPQRRGLLFFRTLISTLSCGQWTCSKTYKRDEVRAQD